MQSSRVLGIGFLLLIVAGLVMWLSGAAGAPPKPPVPVESVEKGVADPAAGALPDALAPATAATATAGEGAVDRRVAVPASAQLDDKRPALVGRVVGADGAPIVGAAIFAAPGMGFANANGQLDFDTFDFADFAEVEDMDPSRMMNVVREQLADRVEAATDADGRFRVQAKGTSRGVGLRVLARGHAILDRRFTRPTEKDLDVGTLTLLAGAIVTGRVLEPDGTPVVGATVSRVHEAEARMMGGVDIDVPEMGEVEALRGGETATTDKAGRFELAHLLPGDMVLRARHVDHPTAKSASFAAEAGRVLSDVLVTMQRGGEIRGVVAGLPADAKGLVVMASKKPRADADPTGMMGMFGGDMADLLADMGMSFGERKAEIGEGGAFVLRGLAIDTYRVWVGRTSVGFAGNGTCSNRVEAMPGANVELRFEPGIRVTLTAVDAKTGAAIERLWVRDRLRGGGGMADLMAQMPQPRRLGQYPGGVVTVANVRPKAKQTLTLSLSAIGYGDWERSDITLPASGALDLGTIKLEPAPVVAVTVLDADDSRPLAGATVRIVRSGEGDRGNPMARMMPFANQAAGSGPASGKSDRDGRVTLNRLRDVAGTIEVEAKDHAPFASETIAFSADGPSTFTARVAKGGAVQVTVVDDKDAPIKEAVVEHKSVQGETATRKTDAQGVVSFEHLAPGSHSFRLGKSGNPMAAMMQFGRDGADRGEAWQATDVQDHARSTLRLVKQPTASLRGVVRENGLPLAGARVAFREGAAPAEQAQAEEMMGDLLGAVGGGAGARTSKTGDDGVYSLRELPEGPHRLQVTHKGRAMPARLGVVLQNGENTFDIELDMTTVRGVVQDPQGNPVDGARIRIKKSQAGGGADVGDQIGDQVETMMPGMNLGGGSTIKTDATGAFELRGVDPDVELVVQATAKGFAPASTKVTATRGATVDAKVLRLVAAGKIKVTAQADDPFAVVVATFVGEGESVAPVTQLLRKGKGTLDGLRPGTWQLTVQGMARRGNGGSEQEPPKHTVEVIAGQTVEVQL